ncbi:hypothetical protein F4604DRAFT_1934356 [Suillus subluteus]|nr:hypothetical protein F4604DRAFT_1934356 [Suillus subluteus]
MCLLITHSLHSCPFVSLSTVSRLQPLCLTIHLIWVLSSSPFHARLTLLCTRTVNSHLFQLILIASCCTFHGVVGIENAAPYSIENRHFWKMDGFIPLPMDSEENTSDLPASIFTYGGRTAPPDDGIELYCVDDLQSLEGGHALPSVLIAGKYGIMPQQIAHICCYYPTAHPRLDQTPVPTAEKYVIIQGNISEVDGKHCVLCIHDITLGLSTNIVDSRRHREAPPTQLKSFNWSVESESTHPKKGKKKQAVSMREISEQPQAGSSTKTD